MTNNCCSFKYKPDIKATSKMFHICGTNKDDYIFKKIQNSKCFYEKDLLEYILFIKSLKYKQNSTIVDVGANIGNHSIFFGEYVASSVISVEANPTTIPVLRTNLERNIINFDLYTCALGAREGKCKISIPDGAENNIGMAKVDFLDDPTEIEQNLIDVKTLDQIIETHIQKTSVHPNISAIKIDVEGAEVDVLEGSFKTLNIFHPDLFVEAATAVFRQSIEKIIHPLGYKRIARWAGTPVYHYVYKPSLRLYLSVFLYKLNIKLSKLRKRYIPRHPNQ